VKLGLFINASLLAHLAATSSLQGHQSSAVALLISCVVNVAAAMQWNGRRRRA
jgi:hypothetical protein